MASLAPNSQENKGWLACTTDDILREKKDLYDVLVELPDQSSTVQKAWPKLQTSDGRTIKASQRDLRRWTLLCRELRRLSRQAAGPHSDSLESTREETAEENSLLRRPSASLESHYNTPLQDRDASEAVEPSSWSALAYRGFMWWASAGEANALESAEATADEELLFDLPNLYDIFPDPPPSDECGGDEWQAEYARAAATLVVAYFRRITEKVLRTMASMVEEADDETEEGIQEDEIRVSGEHLCEMGLDSWSEADKIFVKSMMKLWFDRDASVADQGLRLCGVRIC